MIFVQLSECHSGVLVRRLGRGPRHSWTYMRIFAKEASSRRRVVNFGIFISHLFDILPISLPSVFLLGAASKLSPFHLAFISAALKRDRTYNLGALIDFRLAANHEKGGICGGLLASRLLGLHGLAPHHSDL